MSRPEMGLHLFQDLNSAFINYNLSMLRVQDSTLTRQQL
ncbi:hypothetical protein UCMB321_2108 [Pseudomonas batumici]|uniref:Uncharacterized protein n=1 Tax=Pseudomonas batumici TaxID=226910 RepID=A0A0C2EZ37_9PSED|nr:hypothetical protein UCMB321_2108 [Pseudomonas batumici]